MNNGIESTPSHVEKCERENTQVVSIPDHHQRLLQVNLVDQTDGRNELVHIDEWLLHRQETPYELAGNLFVIENPLTGVGKIVVKRAPLPEVRKGDSAARLVDITVCDRPDGGYDYHLHQTGPVDLESWQVLDFEGGARGCTQALHRWQQRCRPQTLAHRLPVFVSNSWGDRNRDARIQHDFIMKEIDCAAALGVDVVQIDDGWQKGISSNSAYAKEAGGVWSGFWDTDSDFWTPHPDRFPEGLEPIVAYARSKGIEISLWYAPDSHDEFSNWHKDVAKILELHKTYGCSIIKLDSINAKTEEARRNLKAMLDGIINESGGAIACDLDITGGGSRPGYFGAINIGPLYVENRYTDWGNYWPHQTLRNLWKLSHWIDPRRLRMEILNNERNTHKYDGDPLAPVLYPPATLFAMGMFASPLGFFENTGLSEKYLTEMGALVQCWRKHREQIFAGDIYPVGDAPDGAAWTGFCCINEQAAQGYAVIFNEKNPSAADATIRLPFAFARASVLHGSGRARVCGHDLFVSIPNPFGYLFIYLESCPE